MKIVTMVQEKFRSFAESIAADRINDAISNRYLMLAAMVSRDSGVSVMDIPIKIAPSQNRPVMAAYHHMTKQRKLFGRKHFAGEERIDFYVNPVYALLPRSAFQKIFDVVTCHELWHAVDARTDADYMSAPLYIEIAKGSEVYTDFRAVQTVSSWLYKNNHDIICKVAGLSPAIYNEIAKSVPPHDTNEAIKKTDEIAFKYSFV